MNDRKRVLLLSSSTIHGRGYLDHAEEELRDFLSEIRRVLFVPFALHDQDAHVARVHSRFAAMECEVDGLHAASDMRKAIENAEAIFIGGGNTFRLLKKLYEHELLYPIRRRVEQGMPYIGSSAGSNVAGLTIRTTNDMPIVEPPSFESLGLVALQINPHYLDADPNSTHMGETREERIAQFHEENDTPVIGLREAAFLRMERGVCQLRGTAPSRYFCKGKPPVELPPGSKIEI